MTRGIFKAKAVGAETVLVHVGFPKLRGTFLAVPIRKTTVFWGLYWDSLILGNYHIDRVQGGLRFQGLRLQGLKFKGLGVRLGLP